MSTIKQNSIYLENERSIPLYPSLAFVFGIQGAIIIQQIRYWMLMFKNAEERKPENNRNHFHDGRWWVYNSYEQWRRDNFGFWSKRTIQRHINMLEEKGVLISGEFNKSTGDRTKWYTIDFDEMDKLVIQKQQKLKACGQVDQTVTTGCLDDVDKVARSYTENTTENTTEKDHSDTPPAVSGAAEKPERKPTEHQLMFEALCKTWGHDWNQMTPTKKKNFGRVASELRKAGAKPEHIPAFYGWCKAQQWPDFTENVMTTRWDDYRKTLRPTNGKSASASAFIGRPGCPHCGGNGMVQDAATGASVQCPACAEKGSAA